MCFSKTVGKIIFIIIKKVHTLIREVKALHFFNGEYIGYCLKYYVETLSLRVF